MLFEWMLIIVLLLTLFAISGNGTKRGRAGFGVNERPDMSTRPQTPPPPASKRK